MACVSSALIVGGGIAGLSAAIALARQGVRCEVLEIADAPLGASLGLSGRATDALVELGVYQECHDTGRPFTADSNATSIRDAKGELLHAGAIRPQWPGAKPNVAVYRPVFLQVLADTAQGLGVTLSMAVIGEPRENGYAERLMRTIKEEEVNLTEYEDFADAQRQMARFLDDVYNIKRIHSSLGYLTPREFEEQWRESQAAATTTMT